MYERFIRDFFAQYPKLATEPSIELGLAIKHIRLRMGLTQDELAQDARLKLSALKTLENGYAKFTKTSNLEAIARVLRVSVSDIIQEAREWFYGNFFVLKFSKKDQETRLKRKPLPYPGFTVDLLSPPIATPAQFSFAIVEIEAGQSIKGLKLPSANQVAGFIQRGTMKLIYDSKGEFDLFANQSFSLRGDKIHDLMNADPDNPLRLCLVFSLAPGKTAQKDSKKESGTAKCSVGRAIRSIRHLYSDSKNRPLSFTELSYRTGLTEKSLQYLERTTEPNQVVYWDKIEKITQALNIPLTRFLGLAEGKDEGHVQIATAHDRALVDYRHYLGVRIKSALFPSAENAYHLSEMYLEPKGGIRRASWKRRDKAMIAVHVEDGELLIEVGKNRKAMLTQGESVYFDGRLGYIFTNSGEKPAKLLVATSPALIF